mmetsp:Transcript_613/g.1837  ORF Transcript_613/g.1837 Transcript_613/m.1837 type:complete len:290 (-) Transcript_613:306-1175(-)
MQCARSERCTGARLAIRTRLLAVLECRGLYFVLAFVVSLVFVLVHVLVLVLVLALLLLILLFRALLSVLAVLLILLLVFVLLLNEAQCRAASGFEHFFSGLFFFSGLTALVAARLRSVRSLPVRRSHNRVVVCVLARHLLLAVSLQVCSFRPHCILVDVVGIGVFAPVLLLFLLLVVLLRGKRQRKSRLLPGRWLVEDLANRRFGVRLELGSARRKMCTAAIRDHRYTAGASSGLAVQPRRSLALRLLILRAVLLTVANTTSETAALAPVVAFLAARCLLARSIHLRAR